MSRKLRRSTSDKPVKRAGYGTFAANPFGRRTGITAAKLWPQTASSQKKLLSCGALLILGLLFARQTEAINSTKQPEVTPGRHAVELPIVATPAKQDDASEHSDVNELSQPTAETTEQQVDAAIEVVQQPTEVMPNYRYKVRKGDTLSAVFRRFSLSQQQMYQILEADYALLALDTLMPEDELKFWVDPDGSLERFELEFDLSRQVVFTKAEQGFEVNEVLVEGDWTPNSIEFPIQGSFSLSAQNAGLSIGQSQLVYNMFKDKLDFNRKLRAGDSVRLLYESQSIEGTETGKTRLLAVEFEGRNWINTAYLHDDGSYYDTNGDSLNQAFMRHPFKNNPRISSKYNPRRLHPVTKRVSPHNGTDYAAPRGTTILAAGDGVVKRVENHPIAGKYVVIQHGGEYRTRYLHMNRIDVRRGQTVSRGQKIGTVGSTGRVTGAHLHYEFHIRGRAVNSLTAKIPMATSVSNVDKPKFNEQVSAYKAQMSLLLANQQDDSNRAGGGSTLAKAR